MSQGEGTGVTIDITPRNAYFASSCPERVQLDILRPGEPLPDSEFMRKLFEAGNEYEDETLATLFEGVEDAVVVLAEDPETRESLTVLALEQGISLVAGGRLPVDLAAHRVGEPDLLVRHGDGYIPVDVKSHMSLVRAKEPGAGSALVSDLDEPFPSAASVDPEFDPRRHLRDLLQLAHYRRLLEAGGYASSEGNVAGICGTEGVIVWYDLDRPWLHPSEYLADAPEAPLSAMARYDLDFAQRLEVHRAAVAHVVDDVTPLQAEPIVCDQCPGCRWRDWCGERLEEAADLSLIFGVGAALRRLFKEHGVGDLHELASLDWTTAELVGREVDLDSLISRSIGVRGSTLLSDVIPDRPAQLDALASLGVDTVADLDAIDRTTLDLSAAGATNLATQIDLARARTGPAPAYRRRGVSGIDVPRGDIEVDVDMENTNEGCYIWGALVTDRRSASAASHYVAFASWDPDLAAGELVAFEAFWTWLTVQRASAAENGASFRAYCYSRSAEEGQMTRIADRLGMRAEIDDFLRSEDWVDLYAVVRSHLVTGRSLGLKEVAPLAGFAWTSAAAGGTQAMLAYDIAVEEYDPVAQAEAQGWILTYNEDDVRATATLRDWLDGPANGLPSIAEWAPR